MSETIMESTPTDTVVGKADWYTVRVVTPIVEGNPRVPLSDRRRFCEWLDATHSARSLMPLIRSHDMTVTILGRLAEEYAWFLESKADIYCMDLLLRAEDTDDGIVIAEPPTPGERLARAKEKVRKAREE